VKQNYSGAMENLPRYAIYYVPAPGSVLDRFGATLLGYDAHQGTDLPFPDGLEPAEWRELTQDPRKYGFHATLKAPMTLAPGRKEEELAAACAAFAATPRVIPSIEPVVDCISGFIAVVPARPLSELQALAADCVRTFDPFRAPLTEEDRARRNPSKLTERQRRYLDHWGYPYVLEEFRFHMTLTGSLDAERRPPVLAMLKQRFSTTGIRSLPVDRIALFRQSDADARFRVLAEWPLAKRASTDAAPVSQERLNTGI
jgi:putative phosphonate metabolism protein